MGGYFGGRESTKGMLASLQNYWGELWADNLKPSFSFCFLAGLIQSNSK